MYEWPFEGGRNTNLEKARPSSGGLVIAVLGVVLALGSVLVPAADEEGDAERPNAAGLSELLHHGSDTSNLKSKNESS